MQILNYWYLIAGSIMVIFLYFYKERKKDLEIKNKSDIQLMIYGIIFLMVITYIQKSFFNEHAYFLIGFLIFIPILTVFILYLFAKNIIVLIESRVQGEMFYEMGVLPDDSIKEKLNTYSGILVHIMDRVFYETLDYYGNPSSPFKNVGDKVKYCDYFNGTTIYCPDNPLLQNITLTAHQGIHLSFKKTVGDILHTNTILTDLMDYRIQFEVAKMRVNFPHALIGTEEQYANIGKPFPLEKSIDEKMQELINKQKALHEKAEKPAEPIKPIPVKEVQ